MPNAILRLCCYQTKAYKRRELKNRKAFLNYWNNYGHKDDIKGTMLDNDSNNFEETDRYDVCGMLPCLKNKTVLDIGAGIGRFTAELGKDARCIYVSEFKQQYIKQLKELKRIAKKYDKKIIVKHVDATKLNYKEEKFHLIFTNWLFMNFSDTECVDFLIKSLKWLKKEGHLKFRESCCGTFKRNDLCNNSSSYDSLNEDNFAIHRIISVYIRIIEQVRYMDSKGEKWKFNVVICGSVPAYINKASNWNEVQLLAKKIKANKRDLIPSMDELIHNFNEHWVIFQEKVDTTINTGSLYFADKLFLNELESVSSSNFENSKIPRVIFIYQPYLNPWYKRINPFNIQTIDNSFIWTNEGNRELFRCSLKAANTKLNKKIYFTYCKNNIMNLFNYVKQRKVILTDFLAIDLLNNQPLNFVNEFLNLFHPNGKIILLESFLNDTEKNLKLNKTDYPYKIEIKSEYIYSYVKNSGLFEDEVVSYICGRNWMMITVYLNNLKLS
uniref:phosphoethanolamine N-methyltransferase n=1 Tax=Parastrongyloides trichosuri TaxID=131310 RepID=A0A0N4ZDH2_PARTI